MRVTAARFNIFIDQFWSNAYLAVGSVCGVFTFIAVWMATINHAGWIVGLALGWVPAYMAGALAVFLGPIALLVFGGLFLAAMPK